MGAPTMKKTYNDEIDRINPDTTIANLAEFFGRNPDYKINKVSLYLLGSILSRQLYKNMLGDGKKRKSTDIFWVD